MCHLLPDCLRRFCGEMKPSFATALVIGSKTCASPVGLIECGFLSIQQGLWISSDVTTDQPTAPSVLWTPPARLHCLKISLNFKRGTMFLHARTRPTLRQSTWKYKRVGERRSKAKG